MKRILYFTFSILLILFGIYSAYELRWISDDAFISLRYAKNLADGKGLVFNEGEKVEGYTNFLWTLLLTLPHFFEMIDPIPVAYTFGIFFFLCICIYLFRWNFKETSGSLRFPFALSCFILFYHNRVFATGGLETSLHSLLFLAASYHLIFARRVTFYHWLPGILFSALTCLNRPDGLLFHGLAGIYTFLTIFQANRNSFWKNVVFQNSFLLLIFAYASPSLFYIWKLEYYGNLLPNTFYAKSGGDFYLEQGLVYFLLFLKMYYALVPILGISLFLFIRSLQTQFRKPDPSRDYRWILLFLFPVLYSAYYTWIGGDFMFSRFYLPILPLLFVWVESGLFRETFENSFLKKILNLSVYVLPLLILLRWDIYKGEPLPILYNIADENKIYKRETTEKIKNRILPWKKHFETSRIKVAFAGSECIFIYYLNPILAIETEAGLTDPFIARLGSKQRGRIGHEKTVPLEYLKKRNIELLLFTKAEIQNYEFDSLKVADFGVTWKILNYSPSTMNELAKITSFSFLNFEEYLDRYQKTYLGLSPKLRKEKYRIFEEYYFRNSKDKNRQDWYQKNL
ncbi:hypothetical protein JWG45_16820 [Leptospira sp. 201903070]|uniref:Glycosyltransferase RgtA/B/C/D-like domain-containing protein n=1 Tax=Leptospira ainlahdjerensis TaxID=2810033 RepID=A0ABS2UG88_9LEPT|nr:hypothetical protein [Leptospira ainlahdjerensis]MBM9578809.1 hypothetical protein [Leptospira ainlahdjerensis]